LLRVQWPEVLIIVTIVLIVVIASVAFRMRRGK
jgi:hypothetical protein